MTRKFKYYLILSTGIIVFLVGLINFFTSYGDTSFSGIISQITGVIVCIGGVVNLVVAVKLRPDLEMMEQRESDSK
ncbi:MAG: hypothetical protein LAT67_00270 [Balneolales bacterium]|nr:hypothetical protein [Balneolales bacterium]